MSTTTRPACGCVGQGAGRRGSAATPLTAAEPPVAIATAATTLRTAQFVDRTQHCRTHGPPRHNRARNGGAGRWGSPMTDAVPSAPALPDPLVATPQWVCWRAESRGEETTKVPVEPGAGDYASTTDPDTWRSFEAARAHARETDCGVGFVLTAIDRFVGVDLDDCRDPDSGALTARASRIVGRLDSYTEVSPSGTGVHVLAVGELPEGRSRHETLEMYDAAQFFTVTGESLPEAPTTVKRRSDALAAVHEEFLDAAAGADAPTPHDVDAGANDGNALDDQDLLAKATTAANGAKFARLYRGSTAGYPSQSEADLALCGMLAFWTGCDATQMDRLFRDSGLMRAKWDEVHFGDGTTHGEWTIKRAIALTTEVYTGGEADASPAADGDHAPATADDATAAGETQNATVAASPREGQVAQVEAALAELRDRLDDLEAENDRLEDQLEAERRRRRQLETEEADKQGLFGFLRFGASRDG